MTHYNDNLLPAAAYDLAQSLLSELDAITEGFEPKATRHRRFDALLIKARNRIANLEGCDPAHRTHFFKGVVDEITSYRDLSRP